MIVKSYTSIVNQARVDLVYHQVSGSSVPLFFPLKRLSLIHPHRRVLASLKFFVLALVPVVLMGLLELLGGEHSEQSTPFVFPEPLC